MMNTSLKRGKIKPVYNVV